MTHRLTIHVTVEGVDPTLADPEEVAELLVDVYAECADSADPAIAFDAAQWDDQ